MAGFVQSVMVAALSVTFLGTALSAETKVGTTIESRLVLGFKSPDSAVQAMLPEGWTSIALAKGPMAGTNLLVALLDRHLILDADGNPESPSSGLAVAFFAYAKAEGVEGVRGYVLKTYEEPPFQDPYGTAAKADIRRVAGFTDEGEGVRSQTESWTIVPAAGGEFAVDLSTTLGGMNWSTGQESRPFSAVDPGFSRIYRYDQLVSLVMSVAAGRELAGEVAVTASDPEIADLFDGTEQLVSILSIPFYNREISLP